ncbi:MAG: hypothetical protein K8R87_05230 [Verrucomicrobia bacterium]|nr:hypothetical protein [Verrucomicrobiota bacterium]
MGSAGGQLGIFPFETMIKNFHFKMLIGFSIYAFVMSFIYLSSGLHNSTDRVGTPIGGLFSALGFFAAITACAIRSINRRLDRAGIADDPEHPTSAGKAKSSAAEETH